MKHNRMSWLPICAAIIAVIGIAASACSSRARKSSIFSDTVNVVTLSGPASYFVYRDTTMGYDYELMEAVAKKNGVAVNWIVANSLNEAITMIDSDEAVIIASEVPQTNEYRKQVLLCGPENKIEHVLVQPPGDTVIVDVKQLAGQMVYVEKDSKSYEALEKVNKDLGGTINIRTVDPDSLATEDMLAAVARGDLHLAIVDSETARLNKTYYPDLAISIVISEPEIARWAVKKGNKAIAAQIDAWFKEPINVPIQQDIIKKYFESLKNQPISGASFDRQFKNGYASPYDHLYKQHTSESVWDWRLLAAQGYTESRFDSTARSWAGATGVMQIMPKTARDFGLQKSELTIPSRSIETAVKILDKYDQIMATVVRDPIERQKFVMASYNAGPGHVLDAIRLAKKYGYDEQKWDDNVEKAMLMKMNRKYYRDPVVRYGYSRGRETVDYVDRIWKYYDEVVQNIPA